MMLIDCFALDLAVALDVLHTVYVVILLRGKYPSEMPMGLLLTHIGIEAIVRLRGVMAVDRWFRVHDRPVWSLVAD